MAAGTIGRRSMAHRTPGRALRIAAWLACGAGRTLRTSASTEGSMVCVNIGLATPMKMASSGQRRQHRRLAQVRSGRPRLAGFVTSP